MRGYRSASCSENSASDSAITALGTHGYDNARPRSASLSHIWCHRSHILRSLFINSKLSIA